MRREVSGTAWPLESPWCGRGTAETENAVGSDRDDALIEQLKSWAAEIEECVCVGIYGKTNAWSRILGSDVPPAHECMKTALISH